MLKYPAGVNGEKVEIYLLTLVSTSPDVLPDGADHLAAERAEVLPAFSLD